MTGIGIKKLKNYYKILGVTASASQAEIKKAYRLLAIQYHPDKNSGSKESEEQFKKIAEAYIILGDAAKRDAYDCAKGYQQKNNYRNAGSGKAVPATFLILAKRIKEKVLNAGGHINNKALFKVIDDLLTDDTINLLIEARDIATNSLILDELVVSCIFLNNAQKSAIYPKLLKLADGDPRFINKIGTLNRRSNEPTYTKQNKTETEQPSAASIFLFIAFVIFIILMAYRLYE